MESWESYHRHSDPTGAYSHGGVRYSYTSVSVPRGHESSDDSEGVNDEHRDDPVLVDDLDDPDYDGDPGSPPSGVRDSKVKTTSDARCHWVGPVATLFC